MQNAYHTTVTVLPGNRIEVAAPELREGERVRVVVMPEDPPLPPREDKSIFDIIADLKGRRLFQSAEEIDAHINEERDSWDR